MVVLKGQNGSYDDFPVGMRVLAVDDDPICLKLLDGLLRKCQYQVTLTGRATEALKMLRENKDRFDLVISDVHMPDMDGFKLLELVGLEMDLPVIMLSANSDPKLVLKGVTHGACDYLVKPVRIEELKNIWQHVIRRKKSDAKHQKISSDQDKHPQENIEGEQGRSLAGSADQSGKLSKRRKDEKDEVEENEYGNEDPSTQKKPRVVWSIELHRKFVAAVNQLGIEKAVPKRILDLMNVEGLTRENVASHLQKYRLYLKRISSVATQQANRIAALGSKDATLMRMASLDGLGDFQTLAGSGRLPNTVPSPYAPSAMLVRLNSPAGVNLRNYTPSALIQRSHSQNFNNPINTLEKLPPVISPASHKENLIQGIPSLDLDQLQQNNCLMRLGDFSRIDNSGILATASTFIETRANSVCSDPNGSVMLQGSFPTLNGGGVGNQSSLNMVSFNSDSFSTGMGDSSDFLDPGKCNENWQCASQLSNTNSSPLTGTLDNGHLPLSTVRENHSSAEGFFGDVSNLNQLQNQRWGGHKENPSHNSDNVFSSLNSQLSANNGSQNMDQNYLHFDRKMDMCLAGRSNGVASILLRPTEIENSTTDIRMKSNEDYLLGQMKPQGAFAPQSYDCSDDLFNAVIKREQDRAVLHGEFAFGPYPFGS